MEVEIDKRTKELGKIDEELRKLERLKEDIISNISHELKTPITIILSAIELALMENNSPEELKRFLHIAKRATDRQRMLVENLISSIYLKQLAYSSNFTPLDVEELLDSAVKSVANTAHEKHVKIDIFVEKGIKLNGNKNELELALYNLLDNAVKFNKNGGKIKITAKKVGKLTEICIHDTGIGIPEEYHEKIFEKFFQVDSGTTRKYNGIGIGLSVAKEIIEAHGGRILLESEPEKGSKFTIVL